MNSSENLNHELFCSTQLLSQIKEAKLFKELCLNMLLLISEQNNKI